MISVVEDEKYIYLTSDDYILKFVGNNAGKMEYSIEEYKDGTSIRSVKTENIPLENGKTYLGAVPETQLNSGNLYELYSETDGAIALGSDSQKQNDETEKTVELLNSGTCGENAQYEFYTDGVMKISGNGPMDDYVYYSTNSFDRPYSWLANGVKYLEVEDGVTHIGKNAFRECSNLKIVELADSVESIGDSAFSQCSDLMGISIGKSVNEIGNFSFSYCDNLQYIFVNEQNENYVSIDNVLFTENLKTILKYTDFGEETEYSIPDGVETIAPDAFGDCKQLKHLSIPDSVIEINGFAFDGCTNLQSIDMGKSVKSIGTKAFQNCSNLTTIDLPKSLAKIGSEVFSGCTSLTYIVIPENVSDIGIKALNNFATAGPVGGNYALQFEWTDSIPEYAFMQCDLTSVEIPKGIKEIGRGAFASTKLTEVRLPEGLEKIGNAAFDCNTLEKVYLPASVKEIGGYGIFAGEKMVSVGPIGSGCNIEYGWTDTIPSYAFRDMNALQNVILADELTEIGSFAFANCNKLKQIKIPSNVNKIGSYAFAWCEDLESIEIPYNVTNIEWEVFCGTPNVTIVCYPESYAEKYAIDNNIKYKLIDENTHVHQYVISITKEATCTEKGVKTYLCECGKSYTEEIPAMGHAWNSGVVKKQATATEKGEKEYTCTRCSETKTEEIPLLPPTPTPDEPKPTPDTPKPTPDNPTPDTPAPSGTKVATYNGDTFYKGNDGELRCYDSDGKLVTDEFKCDGTYTYYMQADGTPMKDRLTYHPDGEHIIYLDENGHEAFTNFVYCPSVGYICYFDSNGYLYKDQITFVGDKTYYLNGNGALEQNGWFQFANGLDYGFANSDGTLVTTGFSYDPYGRVVFYHWNGMVARGLISDGVYYYSMDETDGHYLGQFPVQ